MSDPWSSARGYGGNPSVLRRRLAALFRAGKRSGCSPAGCMTRGIPTPGWSNPSRGPPRSARLVAVSPWASVQQATLLEGIRIRGEPSTGPDRMLGHTGPCSDQHRGHGYSEFFYDIFDFRSFTVWAAIGKMVETFAAGAFWVRTVTGTPSDVLAFAFMFSFLDIRFSLRYRNWQGLYNGSGPNALGRAGPQTLSTRCSAEFARRGIASSRAGGTRCGLLCVFFCTCSKGAPGVREAAAQSVAADAIPHHGVETQSLGSFTESGTLPVSRQRRLSVQGRRRAAWTASRRGAVPHHRRY